MAKNKYLAGFINGALQMTRRLRMSVSQKLASWKGSAEDAKAGQKPLRSLWLYLLILAYLSSRSVKICVNPWLMNYSSRLYVFVAQNPCNLWLKICEICVLSFQPLTSTKDYVRNYKPFYAKQSQFPKKSNERK